MNLETISRECVNCKHSALAYSKEPCCNCAHNYMNIDEEGLKVLWESPDDSEVIHPNHYNQGGIECWDAMEAAYGKEAVKHFCILNAFKYIWRADHKNGIQDLDKAVNYINKVKELMEE